MRALFSPGSAARWVCLPFLVLLAGCDAGPDVTGWAPTIIQLALGLGVVGFLRRPGAAPGTTPAPPRRTLAARMDAMEQSVTAMVSRTEFETRFAAIEADLRSMRSDVQKVDRDIMEILRILKGGTP